MDRTASREVRGIPREAIRATSMEAARATSMGAREIPTEAGITSTEASIRALRMADSAGRSPAAASSNRIRNSGPSILISMDAPDGRITGR